MTCVAVSCSPAVALAPKDSSPGRTADTRRAGLLRPAATPQGGSPRRGAMGSPHGAGVTTARNVCTLYLVFKEPGPRRPSPSGVPPARQRVAQQPCLSGTEFQSYDTQLNPVNCPRRTPPPGTAIPAGKATDRTAPIDTALWRLQPGDGQVVDRTANLSQRPGNPVTPLCSAGPGPRTSRRARPPTIGKPAHEVNRRSRKGRSGSGRTRRCRPRPSSADPRSVLLPLGPYSLRFR